MRIKSISLLSLALAAAMSLTSCLGSGEHEQTVTYNYTDCFNVVTPTSTGVSEIRQSPSYSIEFRFVAGTADVTMNNISLPGVNGSLSFKLEDLKFSFDKTGAYVIQATNVVPKGNGNFQFTNLSVRFLDRIMDGSNRIPAYYINYTLKNNYIEDAYYVNAVSTSMYYFGNTVVKPAQGEGEFKCEDTYYILNLDPQDSKATLHLRNARFAENMPVSLNFTLRELPFTVGRDAIRIVKADATTPYINNETPNPSYNISNLDLGVSTYSGGSLSFTCNPPMLGAFNVNASLGWMTTTLTPEL